MTDDELEQIAETIDLFIADQVADLSLKDYKQVLEMLTWGIGSRLEAVNFDIETQNQPRLVP